MAKLDNTVYAVYDSKVTVRADNYYDYDYMPDKVIRLGYGFIGEAGNRWLSEYVRAKISTNKESFVYKTLEDITVAQFEAKVEREILSYLTDSNGNTLEEVKEFRGEADILYIDHYKKVLVTYSVKQETPTSEYKVSIRNILVNDLRDSNNYGIVGSGTTSVTDYISEYIVKKGITKENYEAMLWNSVKYASKVDLYTGLHINIEKLDAPSICDEEYVFTKKAMNSCKSILETANHHNKEKEEKYKEALLDYDAPNKEFIFLSNVKAEEPKPVKGNPEIDAYNKWFEERKKRMATVDRILHGMRAFNAVAFAYIIPYYVLNLIAEVIKFFS